MKNEVDLCVPLYTKIYCIKIRNLSSKSELLNVYMHAETCIRKRTVKQKTEIVRSVRLSEMITPPKKNPH